MIVKPMQFKNHLGRGIFTRPGVPSGQMQNFPPNADKTGGRAGFTQPGFPSPTPQDGGFTQPGFPSPAPQDGGFFKPGFPSPAPQDGGFFKPGFPSPAPQGGGFTQPGFPSPAPQDGGFTRPGFPSGQGPTYPTNPDKMQPGGGNFRIEKPKTSFPTQKGPATKKPIQSSGPRKASGPDPRMNKFIQDALTQGFDPKQVLAFLSGRGKQPTAKKK